jgi:subtilase family serine protease
MKMRTLIACLLLLAGPAAAQAGRVAVAGTTRPEVARARDLGPVPDTLRMEHVLILLRRSPAAEASAAAFAEALHNPKSPAFHHWLSAAEIGARFGAAPAAVKQVTAWLDGQGVHVDRVLPGGVVLDVSGPAAAIGRAFGTSIHSILVDGVPHIANVTDISVPAALSPMLIGPLSLHDFRPHNRHMRQVPALSNGPGGELVTPGDLATIYNFSPLFSAGLTGKGQTVTVVEDTDLYAKSDWRIFRSVFKLDRYSSGSLSVRHPDCPAPGINPNGDDIEAALDVEWSSAAAPDAAIVLASCQQTSTTDGVTLAMTNLINGDADTKIMSVSYENCETLNTPPGNQYYNTLFQQAAMQGISVFVAAGDMGATDCAGFTNGTTYGIGVSGWAGTNYNIAVGGTDFADKYLGQAATYWGSTNGPNLANAQSYIPEQGWNDTCGSTTFTAFEGFATNYGSSGLCNSAIGSGYLIIGGGGGGPSSCAFGTAPASGVVGGTCKGRPKPYWQTGVAGIPNDGVRDLPDISLYASDGMIWGRQYAICFSDPNNFGTPCVGTSPADVAAWAPGGGGTSYGTPIMAGLQALINQRTGSAWGNSNTVLYPLAALQNDLGGLNACNSTLGNKINPFCVFNDITLGDIVQNCVPGSANCFAPSGSVGVLSVSSSAYQPAFLAGRGYDFATGLGSVNAANLVFAWPGYK